MQATAMTQNSSPRWRQQECECRARGEGLPQFAKLLKLEGNRAFLKVRYLQERIPADLLL